MRPPVNVKLFNPRSLLRSGITEAMHAASEGQHVLIRPGALSLAGHELIRNPKTACSRGENWEGLHRKVFRLVELTEEEIANYERIIR